MKRAGRGDVVRQFLFYRPGKPPAQGKAKNLENGQVSSSFARLSEMGHDLGSRWLANIMQPSGMISELLTRKRLKENVSAYTC